MTRTYRNLPRPRASGGAKHPVTRPQYEEHRQWAAGCPLWRWRARNQVTREVAAKRFGVSPQTIWLWEQGRKRPRMVHMAQLVDLLGPETVYRWVKWLGRRPGWGQGPEGDR